MTTAKFNLALAAVISAAMALSVKAEGRQQEGQKNDKEKKQRSKENGTDAVFASTAGHADYSAGFHAGLRRR